MSNFTFAARYTMSTKRTNGDESLGIEILRVEELSKRFYVHERQQALVAFAGVNFVAHAGQLVGLVGASGSGKSSILKCIYRSYLTTSGHILYRTRSGAIVDLADAEESLVLRLRRTEIRCVSQFLRVMPRKSALQLVTRALLEHATYVIQDAAEIQDRAVTCLQSVGLPASLWNLPPQTFSGGEKQLVNLAQALAVNPRLLLLDEPTASLDPQATERVLQVIAGLKADNLAIVGVFHNREIIERLADVTVTLQGGLTQTMVPARGSI